MVSAEQVLAIARKEIGVVEDPPRSNRTKYGEWYGNNGWAWCAQFVSWVLAQAGVRGYKHAYTPAGANLFRAAGRWHADPKPGDLAYFDFPNDGVDRISHVGIVEKVLADRRVQTIEGNTQPGVKGSQRDGGGVYRRARARGLIVGFARPPYSDAAPCLPVVLRRNDHGDAVLQLQRDLVRVLAGGVQLVTDGEFGAATEAAVRLLQQGAGLTVDGMAGPATFAALAAKLGAVPPTQTVKELMEEGDVLTRGADDGGAVRDLQRWMTSLGGDVGAVDGDFGPKTEAAVKRLQAAWGHEQTGRAGSPFYARLVEERRSTGDGGGV